MKNSIRYCCRCQVPCERQGAIFRKCLSTKRVTVLWKLFFTYDVNQVIDRKGAMPIEGKDKLPNLQETGF